MEYLIEKLHFIVENAVSAWKRLSNLRPCTVSCMRLKNISTKKICYICKCFISMAKTSHIFWCNRALTKVGRYGRAIISKLHFLNNFWGKCYKAWCLFRSQRIWNWLCRDRLNNKSEHWPVDQCRTMNINRHPSITQRLSSFQISSRYITIVRAACQTSTV